MTLKNAFRESVLSEDDLSLSKDMNLGALEVEALCDETVIVGETCWNWKEFSKLAACSVFLAKYYY